MDLINFYPCTLHVHCFIAQALTPVRRSARKPRKSEVGLDNAQPHGQDVAALLENTNYCYTPNKELTPLLYGGHDHSNMALKGTEGKQLRF